MASLKGKKTLKNLLKKGFKKASGDHNYLEFWHNGKFILQTFMSHNGQDINDYLIAKMKKQCKIEKEQFIKLAECTLTEKGYVEILIETGYIDPPERLPDSENGQSDHTIFKVDPPIINQQQEN